MEPSSPDYPPLLSTADAQEDRTNDSSSDSIKIEHEEDPSSETSQQQHTTSGREEERGDSQEEQLQHHSPQQHLIDDEGPHDAAHPTSEHILDEQQQHTEKSAPIQPSSPAASSQHSTPLAELDWGLLTGGSEPSSSSSSSAAPTHPSAEMDHGHRGGEVLLSTRPASPAPAFRVRLDSRELASSDIVVEEVSDPLPTSLSALAKGKGKAHAQPDEEEGRASDDHGGTVVHHGEDEAHADGAQPQRQRSYSLSDPGSEKVISPALAIGPRT